VAYPTDWPSPKRALFKDNPFPDMRSTPWATTETVVVMRCGVGRDRRLVTTLTAARPIGSPDKAEVGQLSDNTRSIDAPHQEVTR
jgi:hypothetical protein